MTGAGFAAIVSRAVCLGFLFILALDAAAAARETETDEKTPACLSGPKGTAPRGERWHYRVERNTKRHCWYTRSGAGIARKEVQRAPAVAETARPDPQAAQEPLQLSVANARAEADLSAIPKPDAGEAPREVAMEPAVAQPAWKLADRWSEHQKFDQPPEPVQKPMQLAPATIVAPTSPAADDEPDDMLNLAGLALALLGLSTALTAILMRRLKPDETQRGWHFAGRAKATVDPELTANEDQDDALPIAWRELPAKRQRDARQMTSLRDSALQGALRLPQRSARSALAPKLPHQAADEIG